MKKNLLGIAIVCAILFIFGLLLSDIVIAHFLPDSNVIPQKTTLPAQITYSSDYDYAVDSFGVGKRFVFDYVTIGGWICTNTVTDSRLMPIELYLKNTSDESEVRLVSVQSPFQTAVEEVFPDQTKHTERTFKSNDFLSTALPNGIYQLFICIRENDSNSIIVPTSFYFEKNNHVVTQIDFAAK